MREISTKAMSNYLLEAKPYSSSTNSIASSEVRSNTLFNKALIALAVITFFLGGVTKSVAQCSLSDYTFTKATGTFTPISGSTKLPVVVADDASSTAQPIGFEFFYAGRVYNNFYMNSNGYVALVNGVNTASPVAANIRNTNNSNNFGNNPILFPLFGDLAAVTTPTPAGDASYILEGTAPNRVLTIQWLNWKWGWSATAPSVSFQAKIYEGTNKIEYVYKPGSVAPNLPVSIGMSAPTAANAASYLSANTLSTTATVSGSTFTTNIQPASVVDGLTYTFTPPAHAVTITQQPSAGAVFNSGDSPITITAAATASSALSYQWQQSADNGITWTNVSNNATFSNATTASLSITNPASSLHKYLYRCQITAASSACPNYTSNFTLGIYQGYTVINDLGGVAQSPLNDLRISIGAGGQIQVKRNSQNQVFDPAYVNAATTPVTRLFNGVFLTVGTTVFGPSNTPANNATTVTPFVTVSHTGGSMTGDGRDVLVLKATKASKDYLITLTYDYVYPNSYFNIQYKVDVPAGNTERVKLYHLIDTYLQGGDAGPAYIQGRPPYILMGVTKSPSFEAFRYVSGLVWTGYYSSDYNTMYATYLKNQTNFTNTLNYTATTDNGIGWMYDFGANTAAGSYDFSSDLVFELPPLPTVTTQPTNQVGCANTPVIFTTATSTPNALYQWQVSTNGGTTYTDLADNGTYSGTTAASLVITPTSALSTYKYRCVIYTAPGWNASYTNAATLTVNPVTTAGTPTVTLTTLNYCRNNTFDLTVTNPVNAMTYIWKKDGIVINGASSATYSTTQTGDYSVQFAPSGFCPGPASTNITVVANVICTDADQDGVNDATDIDDDNDGVLDSTEQYCTTIGALTDLYGPTYWKSISWTGGAYLAQYSSATPDIYIDGVLNNGVEVFRPGTVANPIAGDDFTATPITFTLVTNNPLHADGFSIVNDYGASGDNIVKADIKLYSGSVLNPTLMGTETIDNMADVSSTTRYPFSRGYDNITSIKILVYKTLPAGTQAANGMQMGELGLYSNAGSYCGDLDTDNDGVVNRLDRDSDGDGCSDALESGATSTTTANFAFTGTMGANGLDNSLETAVDNGSLNYTSTYNSAKTNGYAACLDTDNDGVLDLSDLDDDNDGVLDSEECPPFNINSLSYAPAAYTVTNGASASQTFPAAPDGLVVNVFTLDNSFNVRINGTHLTNPEELQFWTSAPTDALFEFLDGTAYSAVWGIVGNKNKPLIRVYIDKVGRVKVYGSRTSGGALEEMRLRNGSFNTIDLNTNSINTFQIGQAVVAQTFISGDYGVIVPPSCDDDNDGIPNSLDLDSDGDGCPDAKEAGVSGTLLSGNVKNGSNGAVTSTTSLPDAIAGSAGNYGANGLANVVETSTESGVVSYTSTYVANARSRTVNGCLDAVTDTDSDGVLDIVDIDDDNDGVLDSIEQNGCYSTGANISTLTFSGTAVTAKTMNTITSSNTNSWISSYSTENFALPLSLKFKRPTVGNTAMIGLLPAYGTQTPAHYTNEDYKFYFTSTNVQVPYGTTYNVTQTATAQDEYSIDISATGYVTMKINGVQKAAFQGVNSAYKISVAGLTTTVFTDIRLSNPANPLVTTCPDTDNDGLPNYLDLDSDGDGCSDAIEAGITTGLNSGVLVNKVNNTVTNTTVANAIAGTAGNYGANGFANVIETSTESGAYSGTYTYEYATSSSIKACLDTDGDGVMNDLDIDDDNDGILDKEECEIKTFYWTSPYTRDGSNVVGTINNIPFTYSSTTGISLTGDVFNYAYFPASYGMPNTDPAIRNSSINTNTLTFSQPVTNPVFVFASVGDGATTVPITFSKPVELEWGRSNSAISFTNSTTISSNEGYLIVRIPGIHSSVSFTYSVAESWSNYVLGYQQSTYCDTDGDGITNNLDLDSDGDNCPDAVEAGVTSLPASGIAGAARLTASQISGNYGSNGFADVLETTAGSGIYSGTYNYNYAINSTVNACTDTDSDSTSDLFDLDDDNDGVLDSVEENCVISAVSKTGLIITKPAGITYTFNSNTITNLIDGADSPALVVYNPLGATSLSPWLNFEFPTPKTLSAIEIAHHSSTPLFSLNSTYKIQASSDNVNWKDLSGVLTYTSVATSSSGGSATNFSNIADISSNRTAYKYYRIYGISGRSGGGWATEIYFKDVSCASDVDGDGVPNFRDLDSDGDGCSDAIEAGSSTTATSTSTYPTGTDSNGNGLFNNYEGNTAGTINYTSTYSSYALVSSINACTDTDSDGVRDVSDLDDDNDGVLDTVEDNCSIVTTTKTGLIITKPATINYSYNSNTIANLIDGVDNNVYVANGPTGTLNNSPWFNFEFPTPKALTYLEIGHYVNQYLFSLSSTYKIQGSADNVNWKDVTGTLTYNNIATSTSGGLSSNNSNIANFENNRMAYKYYRIYGISGAAGAGWATEIYFKEANCAKDIDNDGIPNALDLDSDGDGCSDAIEAGSSTTATSTSAYPTGIDINTNGLLNNYESTTTAGIINYTSTYAGYSLVNSINVCLDTDGDGKGDIIDIDDDNDGILDVTEYNCEVSTMSKTGITVSSTVSWGYNGTTLNNLVNGTEDLTAYTNGDFLNQTILQFNLPTAKVLEQIELSTQSGLTTLGTTGTYNLEGWNGTAWVVIETNKTFGSPSAPIRAPGNTYKFLMPNNLTAYTKYRIFGTSAKGTYNSSSWIQEAYFFERSCNTDIDNDGIKNWLDVDSDGDTCPDAVEAGTTAIGTSGVASNARLSASTIPAPYSSNGFATGLETTAGNGIYKGIYTYNMAVDASVNACTDTDSDGIANAIDLDDDNDGVLDATELNCAIAIVAKTGITVSSTVTWGYSSSTLANLVNGLEDLAAYSTTDFIDQTILQFDFTTAKALNLIEISTQNSGTTLGTTGKYNVQGWNGTKWINILTNQTFALTAPVLAPANSYTIKMPFNTTAYTKYRIFGTSTKGTVSTTTWLQEAYFTEQSCNLDTDGDGTPNTLDTDSDGDGCSDAVEAGTVTGTTATTVVGTYDANGFANSLETATESGIYSGTYSYQFASDATFSSCRDTDNDGVTDVNDIDDDNDGILDNIECPATELISNGNFANGTTGWTVGTGWTLINGAMANFDDGSNNVKLRQTIGRPYPTTRPGYVDFKVDVKATGYNNVPSNGYTASITMQVNGTKYAVLTNPDNNTTTATIQTFNGALSNLSTFPVQLASGPFTTVTISIPSHVFFASNSMEIGFSAGYDDFYIDNISVSSSPNLAACDTDGDGIPNLRDLDSDGDGCFDAVEAKTTYQAGSGIASSAKLTSSTLTGAISANGFIDGIETGIESGLYSGTYLYSRATDPTIKSCVDSDFDGVPDVDDLDDDNDGISDATEMGCSQGVSISGTNGGVKAENTAPPGWLKSVSSPDIADATGHVYGLWNVGCTGTAPLPPNGHLSWMSFFSNTQEAFKTTLTNLVPNKTYSLQVHYGKFAALGVGLGQVTIKLGTTVIDQYTPTLGCGWETRTITFTATGTSQELQFQNTGPASAIYNTNVSISADAISPICVDSDTDGDGIPNRLDLDSDGDGCSDANEAYNSSTAQGTDGNSYYGTGNPPAVDASGKVTGASYAGTNANVTTAGTASVITAQPLDAGVSPGATATFTATVTAGSAPVAYQWQLSTDGGTTWANVTNTAPYSGATTAALTVTNVTMSMKGYSYKLVITQANYVCGTVVSNPAKIEITPFASIVDDAITAAEDTVVTGNVLTNDTGSGNTTLTLTTFKIGATTYNAGDTATIVGVGTLRVNSDGSFTFTPEQNYIGTVPSVEYTATDTAGASDSGTLSIVITPTNDAPGATDEGINVTEDTPFSGNVLSNDTDPEGNTLVVSTFSTVINGVVVTFNVGDTAAIPGVGTIVVNANGSFTFTPTLNYIGTVPDVNYTISDGNGGSDTGKLTISINPVNDAPLAADDIVTGSQGTTLTGSVLTNDSDLEGNNLTATGFTVVGVAGTPVVGTPFSIPGVGSLTINSDGTYTFVPLSNFTGQAPLITYTLSDGNSTDTAILDIYVAPVNQAPTARPDTKTINEDTAATGNVLTDGTPDSDPDTNTVLKVTQYSFTIGSTLYTYPAGTTASIPGVGVVVVNANGAYSFTPNANYNGVVPVITYTITDDNNGAATGAMVSSTLTISITPVNDNPITVNDDNKVTPEDTPISGNVLTNDSDPEGTSISVSQFTINGTNYPAGTTATITGVGTLIIGTNGSFAFTPAANYSGAVPTVTYTAVDASSGTGMATLKLAVTPVNDAPVAVDDTATTPEGTAATGNVVTNDTDLENNTKSVTGFEINGITYQVGTLVTIPNKGTLLLNADGTYTFTPVANYSGAVPAITYTVSDGNGGTDTADLLITVTAVNDAPVVVNENVSTPEDSLLTGNVLTNDSDIEGNTLSVTQFTVGGQSYAVGLTATIAGVGTIRVNADGTFIFTPEANYNGAVPAIGYKVSDGTSIVDGSLNITVSPVNDAPTARNNTETSSINTVANGNVITNDSDIEGNALTITQFTLTINNVVTTFNDGDTATIPGVGTLVINEDGSYTFTPETNYYGTVPVATYTISDGTLTATATLTLNVTAPDTDGDGVYDFKETLDGTHPNNFCDYKSTSVVSGIATGAWRAADCDGDGTSNGTDTAPLDPCVHAVNAQADRTNALWQAADCDNDGETNGFEDANGTNPSNGCSFTTAPTASSSIYSTWAALDCDNDGLTNGAEVSGGTDPLNPDTDGDGNPDNTDTRKTVPTATNDTANASVGTATVVNILANDDYLANDGNTITQTGGTATGTVSFNPVTGQMSYTPTNAEGGTTITVVYEVCQGNVCATATVTITVAINDADGDGVSDSDEATDGTSPTNPCDYNPSSQNSANTSTAWRAADCDGDGTPNGTDTDPLDPCVYNGTSTPVTTNTIWQAADCDGDGITNATEGVTDIDNDGTPDYKDLDSDGDGIPDAVEKGSGSSPVDSDNDGTPDYKDVDSDGDGISDSIEDSGCTGTTPCTPTDSDSDGTPNYLDLDSDGDGISDAIEKGPNATPVDTDNDGTPDYLDLDSDGDGISDAIEKGSGSTPLDTDNDGTPDFKDLDSDNDGITDAIEKGSGSNPVDTDSDGTPDYRDLDSDGDGITDAIEKGSGSTPIDTDNDGTPDFQDTDSDNDGISDTIEKGSGATPLDTDNDGTPDYRDTDSDNDGITDAIEKGSGSTPVDTDNDGTPDYKDLDSDDDGKTDSQEGSIDTDGDGTPNFQDLDSDGDGVMDSVDQCPLVVGTVAANGCPADFDGDVLDDAVDLDDDNDGIIDTLEAAACTPANLNCDTDGDGIPNRLDSDSDNDGISDVKEAGGIDTDNDGRVDGGVDVNGVPMSANGGITPPNTDGTGGSNPYDIDSDGDGIPDSIEKGVNGNNPVDTDGDTIPDYLDLDSDGDGIADAIEKGLNGTTPLDIDADGTPDYKDLDSDNDGISDAIEKGTGTTPIDTDGDGTPDYRDTDSDNDGISDAIEKGPSATPVDTDNDGTPDYRDLDSDNDGISDAIEKGSGTTPVDTDSDGTPDYKDLDSDGDGITDAIEKGTGTTPADTDGDGTPDFKDTDSDNDGISDAIEKGPTASPVDTDGDGTPDYRDLDSDNDGILDSVEKGTGSTPLDTDNDGTPDFRDLDSDNDGIPDNQEGVVDTDGDGTPDYKDLDSDGDGVLDTNDQCPLVVGTAQMNGCPTDFDGDGIVDTADLDDDNDGILDTVEAAACSPIDPDCDTDGDGIPNRYDADSDNDGIKDTKEAGVVDVDNDGKADGGVDANGVPTATNGGTTPPNTDGDGQANPYDVDSDGDGISDAIEKGANGANPVDTDNDGTPDYLDLDSDNDGITDAVEKGTGSSILDTDGDGTPDYRDLDSDNDGITDAIEKGPNGATPLDTDSDGTPDYRDLDSDNDGISDAVEKGSGTSPLDTDNDGTPDYREVDSDNDGISDAIEKGSTATPVDTDSDGTPDYRDLDSDNDGITDSVEKGSGTTPLDTDSDGTPDYRDLDSDNDGIPDSVEKGSGTTPLDTDSDGTPDYRDLDSDNDGISDAIEKGTNGLNPVDTDGDGIPDYKDTDSDNDGIPDSVEKGPNSATPLDTDGDGTPDYRDLDSDNDGITDAIEKGPNGSTPLDTDGDGSPDYRDTDSDGDNKPDNQEGLTDTDGDGIPNYRDTDSDNDSVLDINDQCPYVEGTVVLNGCPPDSDNDGIPDNIDLDDDNDGILDTIENGICSPTSINCDTDGDGIPNRLDPDSDNDGISDVIETNGADGNGDGKVDGSVDANGIPQSSNGGVTPPNTDGDANSNPYDLDSDGDGIPDAIEKGANGNAPVDTDGDGTPDYLDLDSDNDGIPDTIEKGTGSSILDTDGDGTPDYKDVDSDNDGISDVIEKGTNGVNPVDADGDGIPDYRDLDSDNDGITDAIEKGSNGATPVDTDGDGTPDYRDIDSDGDGVRDFEDDCPLIVGIAALHGCSGIDSDNDGIPDAVDLDDDNDGILDVVENAACTPSSANCDTDGDGIINSLDLDSDNDGITDARESNGTDANGDGKIDGAVNANGVPTASNGGTTPPDTDGDGKRNPYDVDSDGDGISDSLEKGSNPNTPVDTDNDGTPDYLDLDSDNDGISDAIEKGSTATPVDTDNDGTPDYLDLDSDDDGISDTIEKGSGATPVDTDNDGTPDYLDLDSDNDGISDAIEKGSGATPVDTDNDGTPDYLDLDSDDDGISDTIEKGSTATPVDTDNDGTPDYRDLDSDNDGISDAIEKGSGATPVDTDNDGTADYLDLDSDNDGITDAIEKGSGTTPVDTDNDGTPDYLDLDSDNDGITDAIEKGSGTTPVDTDNDGTPDYLDLDSDNDGISDAIEKGSGTTPVDTDNDGTPDYLDLDSDNDGISDAIEKGSGATPVDTDNDGTPDYRDLDSDNDGIPDSVEKGSTATPVDTDSDGTPDYRDLDSDNDGITDAQEKGTGSTPRDTDGDGTPDFRDLDSDNDGITDTQEKGTGTTPLDTDNDGIPDYRDLDSDNDGISDAIEKGPTATPVDTDSDGTPDYRDLDSDNDGISDAIEKGSGATPVDTDNDGTPDYRDLDSDNDGISDVIEKGSGATPVDTDNDGTPDYRDLDSDNDGISDAIEKGSGATPVDTDSDGTPDYRDLDSDNDGISDAIEKGSGATPVDTDNDGTPDYRDLDSDNDGISDAIEKGSTATPVDTDNDGTPDYRDLDSDNDGISDTIEKGSTATPVDTDNDGTPDYRDLDSDNDGISDAVEKGPNGNNPIDTDGDGIPDYRDLPTITVVDTDGDGVIDSQELIDGTDPKNPCSSNPLSITLPLAQAFLTGDCDSDGLTNEQEIGSNPKIPSDEDNNGILDYLQFNNHVSVDDDLEIFNSMTVNGDGLNDVFVIRGIDQYPNNTVTIYNRWGIEVYKEDGYGQDNKFFRGISEGRVTISQSAELPKGTYFYIVRYVNKEAVEKQRSGYLYITK